MSDCPTPLELPSGNPPSPSAKLVVGKVVSQLAVVARIRGHVPQPLAHSVEDLRCVLQPIENSLVVDVTFSPGKSKELNLILAALDAPMRKEPPISEEEKARRFEIGRNYNIGRFRFHNEIHQDLAQKIHLKKHAIKMLPRNSKIREEALKESDEAPPPWRKVPTWTPPIPGFNPSLYLIKDEK